MPQIFESLVGIKFNRLLVKSLVERKHGENYRRKWLCICDCGNEKIVDTTSLKNGHIKSCGCLNKERVIEVHTKHGKHKTTEYKAWGSMIQRCTNKKNAFYNDYGGRGISICDSWFNFANFYKDIGDRPSNNHSLDRIDTNLGYFKENCKWSTREEQQRNKRNTKIDMKVKEKVFELFKLGCKKSFIAKFLGVGETNVGGCFK
jgi:hypothetical protein